MNYCIDLNIRAKMIQLLKENIGGSFCDLELGNGFLATTKSTSNNNKTDKWDLIKIKNSCASKDTIK